MTLDNRLCSDRASHAPISISTRTITYILVILFENISRNSESMILYLPSIRLYQTPFLPNPRKLQKLTNTQTTFSPGKLFIRRKLVIRGCSSQGEGEKKTERRSFLSLEEAGLVEISGLSTHERFLCRLTISSLNLLKVISEQEGCSIEELNAGRLGNAENGVVHALVSEREMAIETEQKSPSDGKVWGLFKLPFRQSGNNTSTTTSSSSSASNLHGQSQPHVEGSNHQGSANSVSSVAKSLLPTRRRLKLDPASKLYFPYEPGKQVRSAVRIKNTSKSYTAFKFQTTAPKSCFMRPPGAILAPGESIIATVFKFVEPPENNEKPVQRLLGKDSS
ncbi:hypothetical protein CRYUN_Cryun34aG0020800 [Craigia yunnanensis]